MADLAPNTNSYRRTVLDNGLRVLSSSIPQAPSASICVFVRVGSRYESPEMAGASHLIEHLMFKGTSKRPTPLEISGTVEGVGGILNAATEHELTVYWCKVARLYMEECLDLLVDMVKNSVFDPEELERERLVVLEEQSMVNDYPNNKVEALLDGLLWPCHPLGQDVCGTRESISEMPRDMLLEYYKAAYSPRNVVISIAGSVDHDAVVRQVEAATHPWVGDVRLDGAPFQDSQDEARLKVEYRKTEQVHLAIGFPGFSLTHPDRHALDLLSVVLGEGMSSRLFTEVREKQGLAYDIHSSIIAFSDCGALIVGAGVDPKKICPAAEIILEGLCKLNDGIPQHELEKAKRLMKGRMLLRMEDSRAIAAWLGSQEIQSDEVMEVDEILQQVVAVSSDDIQRVANRLFIRDKLNLAVVGPVRTYRRLERVMSSTFD